MLIMNYKTADGRAVRVEADQPAQAGANLVANQGDQIREATETFDTALEEIKAIADPVVQTINQLAAKPKETEVTFAVKFAGEAGIILAKSTLEASLQITLKW